MLEGVGVLVIHNGAGWIELVVHNGVGYFGLVNVREYGMLVVKGRDGWSFRC